MSFNFAGGLLRVPVMLLVSVACSHVDTNCKHIVENVGQLNHGIDRSFQSVCTFSISLQYPSVCRIWEEVNELGLTKEGSTRQQSCFTGLMNAAAATGLVDRCRKGRLIYWACSLKKLNVGFKLKWTGVVECYRLLRLMPFNPSTNPSASTSERWCAESTTADRRSTLRGAVEFCPFWLLAEGTSGRKTGQRTILKCPFGVRTMSIWSIHVFWE